MKLHLPLRLFRAVVALMITATTTTIAAEIPSDYTIFTAASYGDVTARMGNSSDIAFLVENDLTFTKLTVMPSNNNYSRFFTSKDPNNPTSITFSSDCYLEVSDEEVLIFDNLNTLIFDNNSANQFSLIEGITEKGYLGGAIVAKGSAEISISNIQSIYFDNNIALYDSGYASYGAAIYNYNGKISICNNNDLTFYNNFAANSSSFSHACGGAIYTHGGEIILNNNTNITFENNSATTSTSYTQSAGSVIAVFYPSYNAFGGAIYSNSGTISLLHNNTILFKNNYTSQSCPMKATSSLGAPSYGGAIYNNAGSISIDFNKSVDFFYNRVDSSVNFAYGGAIYSNSGAISLNNNDFLTFRENVSTSSNSSSKGGAIFNNNSCISINENGIVSFSKNMAAVYNTGDNAKGGAIYGSTVKICDNQNVIFEQNYERIATGASLSPYTYRLRSLYATGDVSLSAANGNFIEFRDSIHIGGSLTINSPYTDSNDHTDKQLGDIIFTGAYTATHLKEIKGATATDNEIANSQTSQINNMIDLQGGCLQVLDGARLNGQGLTLISGSNAKLLMRDSSMNHSGYYFTFNDNTSLELQGENNITASQLIFLPKSSLIFNISEKNIDTVSLTLSGTLNLKGALTLNIEGSNLIADTKYRLLKVSAYDTSQWLENEINIVGSNGTHVSFNDLYWDNNILWLDYKGIPSLTIATWCNESGDGMWNIHSVNWEQGDFNYAYIDGVDIIFEDEGAGNVTLVGSLAPKSVLVNNSNGKDYIWSGSGSLSGNMSLIKQGEGTLTINTANTYTGGTSITGGTLKVGHVQALGIGAVAINGGTLEIGVIDFKNTITTSGNSTIIISNGFTHNINEVIQNNGSLTLQGNFNADALSPTGTIAATRIDLNGNKGESGFVQTAGFTLQLVNGGTVNDDAASITYNGKTITLDNKGIATVEGEILYNRYHIAFGHTAGVKEIAQQATVQGSSLSGISLSAGGILNADASANITATGGSINLTDGTISGSYSNVCMTATQGIIGGSFNGNSSLVGNDYILYSPLQNNGTLTLQGNFNADALTPTGTIAATRVDLNGNKGESGFVQTAGFTLQVVNGGTVNDDDAIITYNGNSITLDNNGIATVEGGILYNQYHIASGHTAGVKEIAQLASFHDSTLNGISLADGGILNANASANVTATGGAINLTDGTISGCFSNVCMTATQGMIAGSFSGYSTLVGNDYTLYSPLQNMGALTLQGNFNADALTPNGTIAATRVDLNGNKGESGFVQTAGFTLQVVNGGTVNDDDAIITYNGNRITLDNNGIATVEGGILYNQYHIASGHTAGVKEIAQQASVHDSTLGGISLSAGGILNADASANVTATGGTINLTDGTISGNFNNVSMTATQGIIAGCFSGDSSLIGNDHVLFSTLQNNGTLTLKGHFIADALDKLLAGEDVLVDINGNEGGCSGFQRTGDYTVFVADGNVISNEATVTYAGHTLAMTGGIGFGKGTIDYTHYLLSGNDKAAVSDIKDASGERLQNITLTNGQLTVDENANVNATGGTITITGNSILSGNIVNSHISTAAGNYNSTISATLGGEGTLTLGGGTVTITGDNTYSGGTTINDGRLEVGHKNALGTGDVNLNGGTLDLNSYPVENDITATGGTLEGGDTYEGKLTVNGHVTLGGHTTASGGIEINGGSIFGGCIIDTDILVDGTGDMEISSTITGDSSLILNNGNLTINGSDNNYTGGTTINGGNLIIGNGTALGTGDITLNGGSLNTNGNDITNNIVNNGGTLITSYVLSEGRFLTIGKGGMHMVGNLTLAGGNLLFNGMTLTVDGKVVAEAPVQVTVCGYSVIDMEDTVQLADFGSNVAGVNINSFVNTGYGTLSYDEAQNTLSLTLTNKNVWVGGKGSTWIQGTNVGWEDGKTFACGNRAVFNTKGSISITGAVEAASVLVDIEKSLTFKTAYDKKVGVYSGYIMGSGCLVKRGKGTLTMNDGNTYSGGTFIEAGTVKTKGITSFGTGAITLQGGTLDLASKAVGNDIVLEGAAAIKSGKKFTGDFTMSQGELLKGSVLNIAETATLQSGSINGTLSGVGTVEVKDEVALGTTGKITTDTLDIDGTLKLSTKGMSMNTKVSAISVNKGATLVSEGALKAYDMEINGGAVSFLTAKATSVMLTHDLNMSNGATMALAGKMTVGNMHLNNAHIMMYDPSGKDKAMSLTTKGNLTLGIGAALTLNGKLTAKNLTIDGGNITLTSTKLQTITVKDTLTLNADFSLTLQDGLNIKKDKKYKLITFKTLEGFDTESGSLYEALGLSDDFCTLALENKAITLTVTEKQWDTYVAAKTNEKESEETEEKTTPVATTAATAEDMLFTVTPDAATMQAELEKAADTLVQSTWGTVGASRSFGETIANRGTHATLLEGGKGAAWISTMGGSSRISSEAGHAGADYTLTGAAFGIEAHITADSVLGLAVGNSWGKVSTFSAYPVDQDSTHAGIYGNHKLGDTLSLSWMTAHTRTESDVNLAGMPCTWSQDALQLDARLTWAKSLTARTTVNAFGGLQYLATDSGECNGIKTGSLQNLRAEIGVGATHRITGDTMAYGELSFISDVVRNNPTADLGGLRSHGTTPGRAGMNLSVGATHRINDDWSVNATYNLELMQNITSHGLNVGATYSF